MRRAVALALGATALPALAWAQCPTRDDLATGVTLTRVEPLFQSSFALTDGKLVENRVVGTGSEAQQIRADYLHGLVNTGSDSARGLFQSVVFEDVRALDRLPELQLWESAIRASWNGELVGDGLLTLLYLETVPFEIDDCVYQTWYVQETSIIDTLDPIYLDKYYAPELGLVLATVTVDQDGQPISNVVYDTATAD
jgi:hypothetical protein